VKCKDTTSPCTYTENQVRTKVTINVNASGALQVLQGAAPTSVGVHAGAVGVTKVIVAAAGAP